MIDKRYYVTKEVEIHMAHALSGYPGPCQNVHGHTYKIQVTVASDTLIDNDFPVDGGMVIDFGSLKAMIWDVVGEWDHKLVIQQGTEAELAAGGALLTPTVLVPFKPTAERMAGHIFDQIHASLCGEGDTVWVESVRVWETPTSMAEVRRRDS